MSVLERRTTDASKFEKGDRVAVYVRTSPRSDASVLDGTVVCVYTDDRLMFDTGGERLIADLDAERVYVHRDGDDERGRPLFFESEDEL